MYGYSTTTNDERIRAIGGMGQDPMVSKPEAEFGVGLGQPARLPKPNLGRSKPLKPVHQLEGAAAILLSLNLAQPGSLGSQARSSERASYSASPSVSPEEQVSDDEYGTSEEDDNSSSYQYYTASRVQNPLSTHRYYQPSRRRKPLDGRRNTESVSPGPTKRRRNEARPRGGARKPDADGRGYSSSSYPQVHCRVCSAAFASDSAMYGHMRHCKPAKAAVTGIAVTSRNGNMSAGNRMVRPGAGARAGSGQYSTMSHAKMEHSNSRSPRRVLRSRRRKDSLRNVIFTFEDAVVCERKILSPSNSAIRAEGSPVSRGRRNSGALPVSGRREGSGSSFRAFERIAARAAVSYGCRHCGKVFMSKYALSGHYRHCMKRKAMPAFREHSAAAAGASGVAPYMMGDDDSGRMGSHSNGAYGPSASTSARNMHVGSTSSPKSSSELRAAGVRNDSVRKRYPIIQRLGFTDVNASSIHRNRFLVLRASRGPGGEPPVADVPYRIAKAMGSLELEPEEKPAASASSSFRFNASGSGQADDATTDRAFGAGTFSGASGEPEAISASGAFESVSGQTGSQNTANNATTPLASGHTDSNGIAASRSSSSILEKSEESEEPASTSEGERKNAAYRERERERCVHVMGYKLSGFRTSSSARWRCQHWTETVKEKDIFGIVERLPKEQEVVALGDYLRDVYSAKIDPKDLNTDESEENADADADADADANGSDPAVNHDGKNVKPKLENQTTETQPQGVLQAQVLDVDHSARNENTNHNDDSIITSGAEIVTVNVTPKVENTTAIDEARAKVNPGVQATPPAAAAADVVKREGKL